MGHAWVSIVSQLTVPAGVLDSLAPRPHGVVFSFPTVRAILFIPSQMLDSALNARKKSSDCTKQTRMLP